ncbi:hypothetical protein HPB49_009127 [Dermacentor silvarum]|uniref:Uncharacterized protein n=1 Tax=Dermacentor silvarum TaxID=543639 RepID=A0ACB8DYD3_DERSI|nr:hypothetical protein HPB49_009127 [Dermacentor silvarum]
MASRIYRSTSPSSARILAHLWYLSVDFQFFLLSLPILLLLKNRPKIAVAIFALLSLVGCTIATWQVAVNDMTPFVVGVTESPSRLFRTGYRYYFYPFYHAVCYFSGCITFFLVAWFRERKIPKVSFFFSVLVWSFLISYFMFIFCEAPTGRLDKLMFEGRRATKEKDPKDEVPNANGSEVSHVVPTLRDSKVEFMQYSSGKDALNDFYNDNGKPTSCHL